MSEPVTTPNRILYPDDVRLVRRVYERIRDGGHLARSPERQNAFAVYLLDMYFRGMVVEAGLYGLGLAAAKARFGREQDPAQRQIRLPVCKVLIVEDDYFVASDIKKAFERVGAIVLGPFGDEQGALSALQSEVPDMAIVDLNLGDGASFDIAEQLSHQSIPLCVVSGYSRSDFASIPEGLRFVPWIEKPASFDAVLEIAAGFCGHGIRAGH